WDLGGVLWTSMAEKMDTFEVSKVLSRDIHRGGLTTHEAPGNRGSWGPCVLAQTQKSL
ncbi:unnamed protein product, partial [Staurois parvus]